MSEDLLKEYWDKKAELDHWLVYMTHEDRYGDFDMVSLIDDLKEGIKRARILLQWQKKNSSIIKKRIKMNEEYYHERYLEEHKYEIHLTDVIQHLVNNGANHY